MNAFEDAVRRGHILVGEVLAQAPRVQLAGTGRMLQQSLDLGTEQELRRRLPVIQRLLAQAIARQEQRLAARIPNRRGEHAVKLFDALRPRLLIEVQEGLDVAVRAETVASLLQAPAQILVIIDLAIADEPERAILVRHGLPPSA